MGKLKEKMFKVYEQCSDGAHLLLQDDIDNSDYLAISGDGDYWGKIKFSISKEMAKVLGECLIELAGDTGGHQ